MITAKIKTIKPFCGNKTVAKHIGLNNTLTNYVKHMLIIQPVRRQYAK
ncbi:hypothetical protein [Ruoffia tabacinasalis]|uniref:Transposase n=1 Tax=Ruoffia tabacinasalis TaxID=87458 RepID=A0ABS0LLG8_9LACT|nr:hypothetical protein [Ruoffia tabacinasalis]MBG9979130.1 hypothetical protein [Ruoffia tabacinasalis]